MVTNRLKTLHFEDHRQARSVIAGDEAAFRQFFDDNYDRLYRFAVVRLEHDHGATEDVVLQTLSKALDNLDSYRGESMLFTWLCAICRNKIIDWQRKEGRYRQRVIFAEDFPEIQATIDSFHAPSSDQPHETLQRAENIRLIQVALDHLPPKYSNALEWAYIEGYSAQEIADRLNIGIEAVRSLLARAKLAFGEVYRPLANAQMIPR